jgi:hypothetical protein
MIFAGARVEVYDEQWGVDHDGYTEFGRTLTVLGRTASGAWLTREDARCSLDKDDIDVLVENDGSVFVSEDGRQHVVDRLAEAFPGAGIHYYEEPDDGELYLPEAVTIFEVEFSEG